jgi:D-alanine--poly(phosphoribitol) ligase subunit 2
VNDSLVDEVFELIRGFAPKVKSAETDLLQAGVLDSASLIQLLLALEERFGVSIPMEAVEIDSLRTAAGIAELVREWSSAPAPQMVLGAAAAAGEVYQPPDAGIQVRVLPPPGPQPPTEALLHEIHGLFQKWLAIDVPSPDTELFRTGLLDSMVLVQLILALENQYGLTLSLEDLDISAFSTTAGIAELVREMTASR